MKRTALVTGGAGFIGSHLSKKLNSENYRVIVYDDLSNGCGKNNLPKDILFVKGNIFNQKKLENYCKKADVVFHLAVKPLTMSFVDPEEVVKINDFGTYIVAKICTKLKRKLVHVSSSEVYGSALTVSMKETHPFLPTTIYAGSKAAAELYVKGFEKSHGLKTTIIRPFNSYGEFMRDDTYAAAIPKFFNRISKGLSPIIYGTGRQTRDFTYVEDICEGIFLADQTKNALGEIFNIGQGKEFLIIDIAKILMKKYSDLTGKKVNENIIYQKERSGDVKRHRANISHARKVLGYKPKKNLQDGITKYLEWKLNS